MSEPTEKKQPAHLFKPGQSGNPAGRPLGARNRLQTRFLDVLASDFEKHGAEAIQTMRSEDPSSYVRAIVALMPKELEIKRPLEDLSDDDLAIALATVQSFLAGQGAGGGDAAKAGPEQAKDVSGLH